MLGRHVGLHRRQVCAGDGGARAPSLAALARLASRGGEIGAAARRDLVADLEALRQAEALELANIDLERLSVAAELGGELRRRDARVVVDDRERARGPRGLAIEARELFADRLDLIAPERGIERELDAIAVAAVVELDAIDLRRRVERAERGEIIDERFARCEASARRVVGRDARDADELDVVDLEHADRMTAVAPARLDVRLLPAPERKRDRTVLQSFPERFLEQEHR